MANINIWNDNQFDGSNNFNYRLFFDDIMTSEPEEITLAKYTQDKNVPEELWKFPLVSKDYVDDADTLLQEQITEINEEIESDYCKLIETEIGFSTTFSYDGTYEVNFVITVNKGELHVEIPMTGYAFKKGAHVRVNANRSGYAGNGVGSCVAIYNSDIGTLKVYAIVSRDVYNAEGDITWSLSDQTGIKVTDGELLGLTVDEVSKTVNDDMDVYTIIRKNGDNVIVSIETITPQVYRDKMASIDEEIERINKIFELRNVVATYADLPTENVFNGDSYIVRSDENFDPPQTSVYVWVSESSEWEYIARLNIDIDLYLTEEESDERYATNVQKIFSDFPENSIVVYQGSVEECLSFLFGRIVNIGSNGHVDYTDVDGNEVSELLNVTIQKLIDNSGGSSSMPHVSVDDLFSTIKYTTYEIYRFTSATGTTLNEPITSTPTIAYTWAGLAIPITSIGGSIRGWDVYASTVPNATSGTNGTNYANRLFKVTISPFNNSGWTELTAPRNVQKVDGAIVIEESTLPTGVDINSSSAIVSEVNGFTQLLLELNIIFSNYNYSGNIDLGTIRDNYRPLTGNLSGSNWLISGGGYAYETTNSGDASKRRPEASAWINYNSGLLRLFLSIGNDSSFIMNGAYTVKLNFTYLR